MCVFLCGRVVGLIMWCSGIAVGVDVAVVDWVGWLIVVTICTSDFVVLDWVARVVYCTLLNYTLPILFSCLGFRRFLAKQDNYTYRTAEASVTWTPQTLGKTGLPMKWAYRHVKGCRTHPVQVSIVGIVWTEYVSSDLDGEATVHARVVQSRGHVDDWKQPISCAGGKESDTVGNGAV